MPNPAVHRGASNGVNSNFVYLVNGDNTVSVRAVTLGVVDGERVAVTKGLQEGDTVVTEGGDRLRDGAKVELPANTPKHATQTDHPRVRARAGSTADTLQPQLLNLNEDVRPHESVTPVHIAPGRHDPADGGDSWWSDSSPICQLPLSALPEVAYPTIEVQTFYPGASPEVMTSAITAPLEKQFGQMPGLSCDVLDEPPAARP